MLTRLIILLLSLACRLSFGYEPPVPAEKRTTSEVPETTGYRNVAYYVNWAVYGRQFYPQDLPADDLTHVLYAFANINSETGEVYLSDQKADTDMHFVGDSVDDVGTNLYGCLKQLYILKKQNRNLKVLLSIGGWSYSQSFEAPAATISGRTAFASSAVSLVQKLGLDGLDIDWEYPTDDIQASNFVLLLKAVRSALDAYSDTLSTPYQFKLTVACPAAPSNYKKLHLAEMDQYVDFWNLMAYDYAGSWSTNVGHQANLFYSNDMTTPFNTQTAVSYYISQGIAANKIVLGMPLYGRAFDQATAPGRPFKGVGPGTWEKGVYDVSKLPLTGAYEDYDVKAGASFSYDPIKKELISYDNIAMAERKAAFIQFKGLGGGMWWESSGDATGSESLVRTVAGLLSGVDGSGLERTQNQLSYLDTTYANLRAGMPDSSFQSKSTTASTATISTHSSTSSPVPRPSSTTSSNFQSKSTTASTATISMHSSTSSPVPRPSSTTSSSFSSKYTITYTSTVKICSSTHIITTSVIDMTSFSTLVPSPSSKTKLIDTGGTTIPE